MTEPAREGWRDAAWRAARRAHHADFAHVLPALAKLPIELGQTLAHLRGVFNAAVGRDWRSMALGFRHVRSHCAIGYREMALPGGEAAVADARRGRFIAEARDEYEARLIAAGRVDALKCEVVPAAPGLELLRQRERGLVLLTPHFQSFFLGVAFLARSGVKVNLMSSSVTHDPRVDPAVQAHFSAKYRGLERYLNGGEVIDLERGTRQFYRMLQRGEVLVILGDAPVLPDGVSMDVDFLGARRRLSGGPLRMAQSTGSDLGGYVCRHLGGDRYRLEIGPVGPARTPSTVESVYRFFSDAILRDPGGWWASDLLPAMPAVPADAAGPARQFEAIGARSVDALVLTDSVLEGSDELALGLRQLRATVRSTVTEWHESKIEASNPAAFLAQCRADRLLVLLQPALLASEHLVPALAQSLDEDPVKCAVAADPRDASGEWAPAYTTQADFEAYVARRGSLPASAPAPLHIPHAFMVDVAAAREAIAARPDLTWAELPGALGEHAVLAPRAFVHSYAAYQQNDRAEMLELLPASVQRLLDVGGGEGGFARAFVERRGGEAWLVEPSAAAGRAPASDKLHVFRGKLDDFAPTHDATFDAVSCLDVLEHLDDPLALVRETRRFLRPGGHLLLSVPNVGHASVVRDLLAGRFDYLPVGVLCGTHLRFFTRRAIEQLLREAGFEAVEWRGAGPAPAADHERLIAAARSAGLPVDEESLRTESLHVLAVLR
ncbi:methyltransferase domain-containing protein [Ramlibacter sp.]|uniref:LpxL/LpxP family acyltransferase n=1 Tax=Ramlibacter sp. TaxID=1917967 RepID=UPI003D12C0F2